MSAPHQFSHHQPAVFHDPVARPHVGLAFAPTRGSFLPRVLDPSTDAPHHPSCPQSVLPQPQPHPRLYSVPMGVVQDVRSELPAPTVPMPSLARPAVFVDYPEDHCHVDLRIDLLVTASTHVPCSSALQQAGRQPSALFCGRGRPSLRNGAMTQVRPNKASSPPSAM